MCCLGTDQLLWVTWLRLQAQGKDMDHFVYRLPWKGILAPSLLTMCSCLLFAPSEACWAEPGLSHGWSDQQKPGSRSETLQLKGRGERRSSGVGPCFWLWQAPGTAGQWSSQPFCRIAQKLEQVRVFLVFDAAEKWHKEMTKLSLHTPNLAEGMD